MLRFLCAGRVAVGDRFLPFETGKDVILTFSPKYLLANQWFDLRTPD